MNSTIYNWTARRSGGRITITGQDALGQPVRIANVDTIALVQTTLQATDKDSRVWELATSARQTVAA